MGNAFGDVVYAEIKLLLGVGGRWGAAAPEERGKLGVNARRMT